MNAIRLRQLILDAAEHVPFYRQHWKAAGVDLTRIGSAVHLEFLPVVRKADLLNCAPEMRLDRRVLGQTRRSELVSGRSGRSTQSPVDQNALWQRGWRFLNALRDVGYIPGEKVLLISDPPAPASPAWASRLARWTYADLRRGEADVFRAYARTAPHVLYGPLSSLVMLAQRMLETSSVTCRPKVVISTGEPLAEAQRALLESAFAARVADFYAVEELGLVAYSKPGSSGYQLPAKDLHLETLRVGSTGFERLVITDLSGSAMPLIRFDTGDLVLRDRSRVNAPIVQLSGGDVDYLKPVSPCDGVMAINVRAHDESPARVDHNHGLHGAGVAA